MGLYHMGLEVVYGRSYLSVLLNVFDNLINMIDSKSTIDKK